MDMNQTPRERRIAIIKAREQRESQERVRAFLGEDVVFVDSGSLGRMFLELHGHLATLGELTFTRVDSIDSLVERLVRGLRGWDGMDVLMSLDSFPNAGFFKLGDRRDQIVETACRRDSEGFVIKALEPVLLVEVDRLKSNGSGGCDLTFSTSVSL